MEPSAGPPADPRVAWWRKKLALASGGMTLAEIVEQLDGMDSDATIYAARPWSADARAIVIREPEDGSRPVEAADLDYFLEVNVALEAANVSNAGTRFERVLHYAENDAFLFDE